MNVTLTVTLTPEGRVTVEGPIGNRLACLGLLEMAKDVVRSYDPKAAPPVEEATGDLARRLLAGRNGGT